MPINIFIDTSAYLSFYAVSNDDLEQLEKIVGLISEGRVKILVTSQVQREWIRNRDNKLAEAISNIEKLSFKPPSIPRFMWEYSEIVQLRKSLAEAEKARREAIEKAKIEAATATTNADRLIQRIFSTAGVEPDDQRILASAQQRMAIGDPPGKPNSLGDRLNWEHLLNSELTDGDLHIITKDGDYLSPLDGKFPKYALLREWVDRKNGRLWVHHEIKPFLSSKFPQFNFRTQQKQSNHVDADIQIENGNRRLAAARWAGIKEEAINALEDAKNSEALESAIHGIERLLPYIGQGDLLRICRFASKADLIHDYSENQELLTFFESIIPRVYHLLDKKEIEGLEMAFNMELHPEEFEMEEDPLAPDYGQMDLDLLDEIVDRSVKEGSVDED